MRKLLLLILSFALVCPLFARDTSRISWIQSEYNRIENSIKHNKFYKKTKASEGGGGFESDATIYNDDYGRVRKYKLSKGTEDSVMVAEYYYDKSGRMFFSFLHYGNVHDLHRDIRSYYSQNGSLIKQAFDANTDRQITYNHRIINPEKHFKNFQPE